MATAANLTASQTNVDGTSLTTAAVTFTAGRMGLLSVFNSKGTTPDTPVPSGAYATWTQIATVLFQTIASPTKRVTVFEGSGAITAAEAITCTFGGATQTGFVWSVDEITPGVGTLADVDNITDRTDSATALTLTLAGTPGDITFSVMGTNSNAETITVPTGWTSLSENSHTTPNNRMEVAWINSYDTTADWTSAPTNKAFGGISIAITDSAAPAAASLPYRPRFITVY